MDQRGDYMKMNFDYFQIQKWMLQTERKKWIEKMGPFTLFRCFLHELWSLYCPKKCIFCKFVLTSARNLSLLGQFTYMLLKVLIILLQKVVRFIGVWATIYEILAIKTLKKIQKCHKILRLWTSISLKE